jgi:hypothetical protein
LSTLQAEWRKYLIKGALVLGDPYGTALVIEDSLTELRKLGHSVAWMIEETCIRDLPKCAVCGQVVKTSPKR